MVTVSGRRCCGCGQCIEPGTPRWIGRWPDQDWHYTCAEKARLTDVGAMIQSAIDGATHQREG
jgi:hypothetical protein